MVMVTAMTPWMMMMNKKKMATSPVLIIRISQCTTYPTNGISHPSHGATFFTRANTLQGGLRPHNYCLPVLKREEHRAAVLEAAVSGNPRFFLGTDSAPHPVVSAALAPLLMFPSRPCTNTPMRTRRFPIKRWRLRFWNPVDADFSS